jgi:DNA-directed RNA polymerase specialized sigma24 family protein
MKHIAVVEQRPGVLRECDALANNDQKSRTTDHRAPVATSSRELDVELPSSYIDRVVKPADVVAQTASKDPAVGLRGVASLRALLEAVEELQVRRARELGWSWQQIADVLGVSKQAVHQMYGKGDRRSRRKLR